MKKLVLILLSLTLLAAAGFAQETKGKLYGAIDFDYDVTQADIDAEPAQFGTDNFNFDYVALGFSYQFSEGLMSAISVTGGDDITLEEAYISWVVVENATLKVGKFYEKFGPELHGGLTTGLDAAYNLGPAEIAVAAVNSGNTDYNLIIQPVVTITPEMENIDIVAGLGAEILTPLDQDLGLNADVNVDFGMAAGPGELGLFVEAAFMGVLVEDGLMIPLGAMVDYSVDIVNPYIWVDSSDLLADELTMNLEGGIGITPVENLSVTPFVYITNLVGPADMSWAFTLRFSVAPAYNF